MNQQIPITNKNEGPAEEPLADHEDLGEDATQEDLAPVQGGVGGSEIRRLHHLYNSKVDKPVNIGAFVDIYAAMSEDEKAALNERG